MIDEFYPAWFMWDEIETLNDILQTHHKQILFECWAWRWWFNKYSWPLWADRQETIAWWFIQWIIQIVWHTAVPTIDNKWHIIYCDVLEHWDWKPLILNIK